MILFSEINLKLFRSTCAPNNLVRKMEAAIDFTFIYDLVNGMYSEVGCLQDEINQLLDKPWKEAFST
ncbi:hypothetical protein MZM54_14655 [[Brevibacterium] frigoritolerans]|nr:hypothetical protein [Peribacillus frigoritolerans]